MAKWARKAVERVKEASRRGQRFHSEKIPIQANGNKSFAMTGWNRDKMNPDISTLDRSC